MGHTNNYHGLRGQCINVPYEMSSIDKLNLLSALYILMWVYAFIVQKCSKTTFSHFTSQIYLFGMLVYFFTLTPIYLT